MSFLDKIKEYETFDFPRFFHAVTHDQIKQILLKEKLSPLDFLLLLSEKAIPYLEEMAQKAHFLTCQYFGKTISLYIPLYLANYCENHCTYCGFNHSKPIPRKKLTLAEVECEAKAIAQTGMKQILLLTGESPNITSLDYLCEAVKICKQYFSAVGIEMFPMEQEQYQILNQAGVDHLTIYQEVYDQKIYEKVHLSGQKKNYLKRLNTPEAGAKAGFFSISLGSLLGLGDYQKEAFFLGLHGKYLIEKYPGLEIHFSVPRIHPLADDFIPLQLISDQQLVQIILALRLFLPRAGINLSTREGPDLRNALLPLGITRFSAGSKTTVGGYRENFENLANQFEIEDTRSISEIFQFIHNQGYQPIFQDQIRG
ncbi:MAG: 2-iminoacetate synthase ThiH [Spirochaetes bacterium]|nr:2-iminoacetate synthase ThiH [Spirochaetota bacterium]